MSTVQASSQPDTLKNLSQKIVTSYFADHEKEELSNLLLTGHEKVTEIMKKSNELEEKLQATRKEFLALKEILDSIKENMQMHREMTRQLGADGEVPRALSPQEMEVPRAPSPEETEETGALEE